MDPVFLAHRTRARFPGASGRFPPMRAMDTDKDSRTVGHSVIATADPDGFSVNERVSDLIPRTLNDPAERGPGNPHFLSGIFMGKAQQIGQPDRLTLIHRQNNLFKPPHRNSPGLEITDIRMIFDKPVFLRTSHEPSLYGHMLRKRGITTEAFFVKQAAGVNHDCWFLKFLCLFLAHLKSRFLGFRCQVSGLVPFFPET